MSQRIGRTVEDEGAEFEVVWPCAEAPCQPLPEPVQTRAVTRRIPTYAESRQLMMALLEQQPTWKTKELLAESMLPQAMFWAIIQHFKRNHLTVQPDRGVVGLRRVLVAA